MLNRKISELLNSQLNEEFHSAYLYLAYAGYFDSISLDGFANWYRIQSKEELDHAMIILRYLTDQGESIRFDAIPEARADERGILDMLKGAKNHELMVTDMINRIWMEASEANDLRTLSFLNWFIAEQSEEEKNAEDMIQRYLFFGLCNSCGGCDESLAGSDLGLCGGGLHSLNREYAERKYSAAAYPFS